MNKLIMDEAQLIYWIIAMVAGSITAFLAISSFRKSIQERKLDLRWKQANAAKEFIHEMHENKQASAAVCMLDWFFIEKIDQYDIHDMSQISYNEVLQTLPKICTQDYSTKERYILECFDWFFYYIDRIEQHLNDDLFLFKNVKFVFYPYFKKISESRQVYEDFMKSRNYHLALRFWKRMDVDTELTFIY